MMCLDVELGDETFNRRYAVHAYQNRQVVSKTLVQNAAVIVTLFFFAKGEEISTHQSDGDGVHRKIPTLQNEM